MDSCKQIYKYLLKQNHRVVELITHSRSRQQQQTAIILIINQYVSSDWEMGNCTEQELTISVSSAENANRLRFYSAQILRDISKLESFKLLSRINIKVNPIRREKSAIYKPKINKPIYRSKAGGEHLDLLADTISDPALKAALERLASHLKN